MLSVLIEFFKEYDYQDVGNIINSLRQERPLQVFAQITRLLQFS
jgi:hypothetical protein